MDQSLVPANSKKSSLIMGMFRGIDLIILGCGVVVTVALLMLFVDASVTLQIVFCIPMLVCALLVVPIPNYHNTLVGLQSIFRFYNQRRKYIWRGWCISNEQEKNR